MYCNPPVKSEASLLCLRIPTDSKSPHLNTIYSTFERRQGEHQCSRLSESDSAHCLLSHPAGSSKFALLSIWHSWEPSNPATTSSTPQEWPPKKYRRAEHAECSLLAMHAARPLLILSYHVNLWPVDVRAAARHYKLLLLLALLCWTAIQRHATPPSVHRLGARAAPTYSPRGPYCQS